MKAVKGNKEYSIDSAQKSHYQNAGFDIYDNGKQIGWGKGKAVSYEDHMRAVAEIEKLQNLAAERYAENEKLKAEIEKLKAEIEKLQNLAAERYAENEKLKAEIEALKAKTSKKQAEKKEGE